MKKRFNKIMAVLCVSAMITSGTGMSTGGLVVNAADSTWSVSQSTFGYKKVAASELTATAQSYEANGDGGCHWDHLVDGNANTFWHTNYTDGTAAKVTGTNSTTSGSERTFSLTGNNIVTITLGSKKNVKGVTILPRQLAQSSGRGNGYIYKLKVSVSSDGTNYTDIESFEKLGDSNGSDGTSNGAEITFNTAMGNYAGFDTEKNIVFKDLQKDVQSIKFTILETSNNNNNQFPQICAAEIGVLELGDKTELNEAITAADTLDWNLYLDESEKRATFENALTAAKSVQSSTYAIQSEVDTALNNLKAAKDALTLIKVTGIKVTTQPTKKIYNKDESFDKSGLVVTGSKNNETTSEISEYTVSDLDSSTTGSKTLTVTYTEGEEQYTDDISVLVVDGASLNTAITAAEEKKNDGNKYYTTKMNEMEAKLAQATTVQNDIKAANGDTSVTASGTEVTADRVSAATEELNDAVDALEQLYKISVPESATIEAEAGVEVETESVDGKTCIWVPMITRVTVTAPEKADGKSFTGWKWDNNVISTSAKYTLYAVENMDLTPSYEENKADEAVKLMFTTNWKGGKRYFVAKRSVPKSYTVVEYGVVVTDKTGWDDIYSSNVDALKKGATRTKWICKQNNIKNGTLETKMSTPKATKLYARAYVVYKTSDDAEPETAFSSVAMY